MKDGISSMARKDEDGTSWESINGETEGNRESGGVFSPQLSFVVEL